MNNILQRIIEKKAQLDALSPLPRELEKNLYEWFQGALTYHSNALEGNTLTFGETAQVIEKQLTVGGKTLVEHYEAVNHAQTIDYIHRLSVQKNRKQLSVEDLFNVHKLTLKNTDREFVHSNDTQPLALLNELVDSIHTSHDHVAKIAADAHLSLVFIHPFVDGNGRTARLLMNLLLLQENYPLFFIKVEDRQAYISAIEKALLKAELDDYYQVIYKAIESSLDEYIAAALESK